MNLEHAAATIATGCESTNLVFSDHSGFVSAELFDSAEGAE
jgi:hypothetical protein